MGSTTRDAEGRLNAFQKVMLQMSSLHPYNATHVYKLAGRLRQDALEDAVDQTLAAYGLGIAHLSEDGQTFRHEPDYAPQVEIIDAADDVEESLGQYVSRSLNHAFSRPVCKPLRFAALSAGPAEHYVVLTYDHWIADSVGARMLLQDVLARYFDRPAMAAQGQLELYPGTYREVFRRQLRGPRVALSALRAVRQWNRNRAAWRVACWSNTQWDVDYRVYHTIPGTVERLQEFARANEVTVHDVLLAAFGRALAEVMPSRGRKNGLALGSIVDTRGMAEEDLSRTFGAFLGYFLVRSDGDKTLGLDEASRQIAARTRPIKSRHRYMDCLVNMQFLNSVWPWLGPTARRHFLRKSLPMSGGISNVVVRDRWMTENRDVILDYQRGASTGPSMPIVLSPTTLGNHMNVGVSYRVAGFSRAKIDTMTELFRDQIEHPNKASRGMLPRRPAPAAPAVGPVRPRSRLPQAVTATVDG